jgi:LPXTG-motif cell wall-anchored protein
MTVMNVKVRRPMRQWVTGAAALLLVGVAAPNAASAERVAYPPGGFSLTLEIGVVEPGSTVEAVAAGCTVGVSIQLEVIGGGVSTTATCEATRAVQVTSAALTGSATLSFQAPSTVGVYTVRAREMGGQGRSATASLTVAAPGDDLPPTDDDLPPTDDGTGGGGSGGGALPKTGGSDTSALLASAAAALLLGGGLALVARRRRRRPAAAA